MKLTEIIDLRVFFKTQTSFVCKKDPHEIWKNSGNPKVGKYFFTVQLAEN